MDKSQIEELVRDCLYLAQRNPNVVIYYEVAHNAYIMNEIKIIHLDGWSPRVASEAAYIEKKHKIVVQGMMLWAKDDSIVIYDGQRRVPAHANNSSR